MIFRCSDRGCSTPTSDTRTLARCRCMPERQSLRRWACPTCQLRLASGVWFAAALIVLITLVRRLGWRNGEIAVVLFGYTPAFIHLARVNFGHGPSLFCISLGLYAYVRGREQGSWRWSALAGLALAAAIYGEAAYYIAAPIVPAGLVVGELIVNRSCWRAYRPVGIALVVFGLGWAPVIV